MPHHLSFKTKTYPLPAFFSIRSTELNSRIGIPPAKSMTISLDVMGIEMIFFRLGSLAGIFLKTVSWPWVSR